MTFYIGRLFDAPMILAIVDDAGFFVNLSGRMTSKNILKYVVLVVVVGNLALFAYVFLGAVSSKKPAPAPLPRPNGYDDFVKAGPLLNGNLDKYAKLDRTQLATLVTNNADALRVLETGLQHQSRVPDDYIWDKNTQSALMPNLSTFKHAAMLFAAEGRFAELEGRTNNAAHYYVEGIRFGEESGRGGVFAEKLVSIACSSINANQLEKIVSNLDAKQCAEIAKQLEAIDAAAETDDEVLAHEQAFVDKYFPFSQRFMVNLVMFKSNRAMRQNMIVKLHASASKRRGLMLAFAARAYELDKGKPPTNAAALVPEYLKKVPQDPSTGKDLAIPASAPK